MLPRFISRYSHYPPRTVIASYGELLLEWLNNYTFTAELQYSDPEFAELAANQFIRTLLENGTTSALVYTTVFAQSTDAFFRAAENHKLRVIAGKVMMDRNAPEGLLDSAETCGHECRALIERWHINGRLNYALTPR